MTVTVDVFANSEVELDTASGVVTLAQVGMNGEVIVTGPQGPPGASGGSGGGVLVQPEEPASGTEDVLWVDIDNPNATPGEGGIFIQPGQPSSGTGDVLWVDIDGETTAGDGGGGVSMEVVAFPAPATTWVVDVGRFVDVVVIDSAGQVVWPGTIVYGPGTQVTLEFSAPFSGEVHCYS